MLVSNYHKINDRQIKGAINRADLEPDDADDQDEKPPESVDKPRIIDYY